MNRLIDRLRFIEQFRIDKTVRRNINKRSLMIVHCEVDIDTEMKLGQVHIYIIRHAQKRKQRNRSIKMLE